MAMFSQSNATMAPPQKPETFMLSDAAQQSLPQDAQVALQQVDNCKCEIELGHQSPTDALCMEAIVFTSTSTFSI